MTKDQKIIKGKAGLSGCVSRVAGNSLQDAANSLLGLINSLFGRINSLLHFVGNSPATN
jgi:hypothetical protein